MIALVAVFVVIPGLYKSPFKNAQVGETIEFGSYEQDGNTSNGKEPIEWRVLAVKGNRALVVSDKALDAHALYTESGKGTKWKGSDLKAWLENDFASQAFSDEDKRAINGSPTLLTTDQVQKYLKSSTDRICFPTDQAVNNGAYKSEDNDACVWWVRISGDAEYGAAPVDTNGGLHPFGVEVSNSEYSVRPAMWVNL